MTEFSSLHGTKPGIGDARGLHGRSTAAQLVGRTFPL